MESWLYFLRLKAFDRLGLTSRIVLFVSSILIILYLINLFSQLFLFNYVLYPLEFLVEFINLLVFGSKLSLIWAPDVVLVALFGAILLWFLAVLVPWAREFFGFIITPCIFPFEPEECLNNIDFQGKVVKRDKEFSVTSSGSGMLFKHYWRDFNAEFGFKFEGENGNPLKPALDGEDNYLGFVFRARDFDNYFMLSIGVKKYKKQKEKEFLLITPHVKVGGAWDVFIGEKTLVEEVTTFSVDGDNKLVIQVKKNVLKLWVEKPDKKWGQENQKVKTKEREPFFTWHLPTHYLINWGEEKEADSHAPGDSSKIPFRNSIGRIGFRAYGEEKFWIRNLTITTL